MAKYKVAQVNLSPLVNQALDIPQQFHMMHTDKWVGIIILLADINVSNFSFKAKHALA